MKLPIEYIVVIASALLLLSIFASKASGRVGIPALLIFLLTGMLAGSEGPGGIAFDNSWLAQLLGVVALIIILFSGGLDTDWSKISPVVKEGISLATLGVFLTAVSVGLIASIVLDFSLLEGLLLGSIVSSTDAAAVFSILRARSIILKGNLKPLLELESGSNDPMAVFLTTALVGVLANPQSSIVSLIPMFFLQMTLGALLGYGFGKGMVFLINWLKLEYEGLYPVFSLALVMFSYGATTSVGGNGFLAVYLAGLVMGNSDFIQKKSLLRFYDGLAWLMQIAMFLTLGLLVFPSRLVPLIGVGLIISASLIFIARPFGVFVSLIFTKLDFRSKTMISWVGLRGAAPIILATFPLLAGLPKADLIFNLVFFIVLTSSLLQGTLIPQIARLLGVEAPLVPKRSYPLEFVQTGSINSELIEVHIPPDSAVVGKQLVELHLPKNALVVLISRQDNFIVPRGNTVLEAEDTMLMLANKKDSEVVRSIVNSKGPISPVVLSKRQFPLEFVQTNDINSEMVEVNVPSDSFVVGKQIADLHLPQDLLVVLISRQDSFIVPRGGTMLNAGDTLLTLASKEDLDALRRIVESK